MSELAAVTVPAGCMAVDQMAIRKEGTGEIVTAVRVQPSSEYPGELAARFLC
jgi:hypothetical protein